MLVGLLTGHINLLLTQDEKSKECLMQEIWCREGNVKTHSMRMPGIGKDKDVELGICQDRSGSNKRGETEQYCGLQ